MHGRDIAPGDTTDFESIASTNSATGALSSDDSISRLRKCPTEAGQVCENRGSPGYVWALAGVKLSGGRGVAGSADPLESFLLGKLNR